LYIDVKGEHYGMSNDFEEPLDSGQAARMLGVKPRTVINLAKQGKIPAFRVGDLWKFLRSDIQAYIDAQRKQTKIEKAEEEER
jgi:excisionase family DNA binding protein